MGVQNSKKKKEPDLFAPMTGPRSNPASNSAGIHMYKAGVSLRLLYLKKNTAENLILLQVEVWNSSNTQSCEPAHGSKAIP